MTPIRRTTTHGFVFAKGLIAVNVPLAVCCSVLVASMMVGFSEDAERISSQFSAQVDLSKYGQEEPQIEFSHPGNLILCWWFPHPPIGDYNKLLGKSVVFDLKGHVLNEATDEHGFVTPKYVLMFPTAAARQHFAWFLNDTNSLR